MDVGAIEVPGVAQGWAAATAWVNVLAVVGLLRNERARLPLQNIVALATLSAVLGIGFERLAAPLAGAGWHHGDGWRMATAWPVAWLGGRAMARTGGANGLALRTVIASALLMPGWDVAIGRIIDESTAMPWFALVARALFLLAGLALMGPWWIRKHLSPHPPLPWFNPWLAPLAVLANWGLRILGGHPPSCADLLPVAGILAWSGMTAFARASSPLSQPRTPTPPADN